MAPFGAPCDQFRSTEDQFLARWREIDVLGKKVRDLDARVNLLHAKIVAGTAEDQRRELVWEAAKAETLAHYAETFSLTWASILIYALLAYMLLGYWAKELLSKIYSALMRFLHKGRFGIGGSARFIGLVEEWSLRWKPKRALLPFYFDFLDLLKSKVPAEEEKPADDQDNTFRRRRPRKPGLLAGLMPKKQALRESLTVEREYYGGGDLFIGRSLYHRGLHVGLKDDRHMMTIGGSRSGKGATAIIANLLTFDGSVLCIDPTGENARITARRRREMGQKVHIVDPFHIVTEDSDCFNPLEHLEEKTRNGI